jgi:hypothetical protein
LTLLNVEGVAFFFDALIGKARVAMNRRAEYCRKQAQRLFSLAEQCVDPQIRDQVVALAREWQKLGNAKESNTQKLAR